MSATGVIFDIKQLAVFDGPGIRTTVFMKGCPLRCRWCHNPEGLSFKPQLMVSDNGCRHCGKCISICKHPEHCIACGECIRVCPVHLRRIAGTVYTAKELAAKLLKDRVIFEMNGGGITLSGGEPTSQPEFVLELLQRTRVLNRAIETCGYCNPKTFAAILEELDFIQMDLKLIDDSMHRKWTGRSNETILENFRQVKASGKPFIIRVPLIPGVNDTSENLSATAALLTDASGLQRVELLPYHKTAGAKYSMIGNIYDPGFDPEQPVNKDSSAFDALGIPCMTL